MFWLGLFGARNRPWKWDVHNFYCFICETWFDNCMVAVVIFTWNILLMNHSFTFGAHSEMPILLLMIVVAMLSLRSLNWILFRIYRNTMANKKWRGMKILLVRWFYHPWQITPCWTSFTWSYVVKCKYIIFNFLLFCITFWQDICQAK